jgi:SOS-response transcriptional repressor LexA
MKKYFQRNGPEMASKLLKRRGNHLWLKAINESCERKKTNEKRNESERK